MTPEEAIRIIEVAKCECEWNAPLEYQKAFDKAISALAEQIPRKPQEGNVHIVYICPNCGRTIDWSE